MVLFPALIVLTVAFPTQGAVFYTNSTFSTNLTLGHPDGSCGQPKDCQVYEPLVQQVGEDSMVPFFKTDVGRVILRYMVLCCNFDHPVLSSAVSAVPNLNVCGYPAPSAAVDIQKQGAWPWLVLFGEYGVGKEFYRRCLGTLISHRHVLSTYSCFSSSLVGPTTARLGAYDIESVDLSNEFAVQKVLSYPNASWEDSDIVIVTLDRPVTFSDYIRPACLPFDLRHEAFNGEDLVVVGYGNPLEGVGSVVPRAVHLPVVDRKKCHQRYAPIKNNNKITDRVICILETSDVPCNGDSGAPVNYFDPESRKYYVVGFASFSVGCQNPTIPGVYTKVGPYLKWIQDSM